MDMNKPILYPVFFVPHMMVQPWNYCPRSPTPPIEDRKHDFTPITISPGRSIDTSSGISSQTPDIYKFLLFIYDVLSTIQIDSEGTIMDPIIIQEDSMEDEVLLE